MNRRELYYLKGKNAIVTGGKGGIGRGIAIALALAGADVIVCDIITDDGELENTVSEIKKIGRRSFAVQMDISKREDVEKLADKAQQELGSIDILVNNAAIMIRGKLFDLSEEEWDRMVDINLKGCYLCSKAVGRKMVEAKKGCIINIASSMGIRAGMNRGAYSVTKAGVIMLTKLLAGELAEHNIRVNAVSPHLIKTEFSKPVWSNPEALKEAMQGVHLGYPGEPSYIGNVTVFLASDASRYVTGDNIFVDGGWLI
ncbi:MAG TPA: SDR family oxidoreductase [Desulfobacteraceae bacterium]|nr:SDR family oxidoreductase [Desulfobacteraceae bacterium]